VPSLLVTKKMSPELRARVQASVEGRRAAPGARLAPRTRSWLRLALVTSIVVLVALLVGTFRQMHRETTSARSALLARLNRESSDLGSDDLRAPDRILPWLALSSSVYAGDLVSEELRAPGGFDQILKRPSVYVRGPVGSFATELRVTETAIGSYKDAFVLCLLEPPANKSEKELRKKALAAYSSSDAMKEAPNVERLADALVGLPYLDAAWRDDVERASSHEELDELGKKLDRAPLAGAKRAARARYLLFLMDEPGDGKGPTELDGERAHPVRVGLIDLATKRVLLRLRRPVDPSFVSASSRAELATGIDSCALALDVRDVATGRHELAGGP
jgi:hypothetical protein